MEKVPTTSWRWAAKDRRFPEDDIIRGTGVYTIYLRPERGAAVWLHVSGRICTHEEAIERIFAQFEYSQTGAVLGGEKMWRHRTTDMTHTRSEVVHMIMMKQRDYRKVEEEIAKEQIRKSS